MVWNLEDELRKARNGTLDKLFDAHRTITELRRQVAAFRRYTEELEKQLEPQVIAEIRDELSQKDGDAL